MFNFEPTIFEKIEKDRELIKKHQQIVEEEELIIDSLTDSLVRKVKSVVIPYSDSMLHTAWSQQDKDDKSMYKAIKKDIIERFFNGDKKAKLEKILPCGYESYAYNFYFTYCGIKFYIGIPNVRAVTKKNMSHANYGAYSLVYEHKNNIWHTITTSYKDEDIAKAIQDFVKAQEVKQKSKEIRKEMKEVK